MTRGDFPDPERFEPVDNGHLEVKPYGGLWTSTYTPEAEHETDWLRWCSTEGYYAGRVKFMLFPKDDLNILEVDTMDDLRPIVERYPEEEKYAFLPRSHAIDFEAIADDGYDGIRLTKQGQVNTRMTPADEPDLYGWDAECTLWFNWCFEDWVYFGVEDEYESPY